MIRGPATIGPTISSAAQKMITDAKLPLNLTATAFLPTQQQRYDSENRAVYASLGFTFTPSPTAPSPK